MLKVQNVQIAQITAILLVIFAQSIFADVFVATTKLTKITGLLDL